MTESIPDDLLRSISGGESVTFEEIMRLHLDLNASGTKNERTLLRAAAYGNQSDLIRSLVSNGAVIDLKSGYFRETALHEAASEGNLDAIQTLLDLGANIESETDCGSTPLICAAGCGEFEAVKVLLSRGANIHHYDKRRDNAWMRAAEKGEGEAMDILKAAGSVTWEDDGV